MKAITYTKYGSPDVLKVQEVDRPTPKKKQVLIQNFASSINAADLRILHGEGFMMRLSSGLFAPKKKTLGCDVAGRVVKAGDNAQKFKTGDEVYGCVADFGMGAHAEYVIAPEQTLALKPENMTFEQAGSMPLAGVTALQAIKLGGVGNGHDVLINGASGGVGTFAVQFAKNLGANVTAVCSGKNADMVAGIGADKIIDYTQTDFKTVGAQYDVIIDIIANCSLKECRQLLKPNGTCVVVGFDKMSHVFGIMFKGTPKAKNENKRIAQLMAKNTNGADLDEISTMFESGKLQPVIDTVYTLDDTAKAMTHFEKQHASGKIVIKINHERN